MIATSNPPFQTQTHNDYWLTQKVITRISIRQSRLFLYCIAAISTLGVGQALAFRAPDEPSLVDFDLRRDSSRVSTAMAASHETAVNRLKSLYPDARIGADDLLHRPVFAYRQSDFLTGTNGRGRAISSAALSAFPERDPHRVIKAFLD